MTTPHQVMHVHGGFDEATHIHNITIQETHPEAYKTLMNTPWFLITGETNTEYTAVDSDGNEFTINQDKYTELRNEYDYCTEHTLTTREAETHITNTGKDLITDIATTGTGTATEQHVNENISELFAALLITHHTN